MVSVSNSDDRGTLSPADVRMFLGHSIPNAQLSELDAPPRLEPIVLLQTERTLAAFGFSNGDVGKSFDSLYDTFRDAYVEQQSAWRALDLAFVFCVPGKPRAVDGFLTKVEVDVYFCRKFVVRLQGSVEQALSALPFVPLSPLTETPLRPPSAQTFLQRQGLSASLARHLVVKGKRSAARILETCIAGEFGPPYMSRVGGRLPLVPVAQGQSGSVRFRSIAIDNFRAYRKETFEFGDAVTMLYGPNGFGKTSVFDAIDFAATGDVGRLNISDEGRFARAMVRLGAGTANAAVRLTCTTGNSDVRIERTVAERRSPLLNGERTDRKTALSSLTRGRGVVAERVDNLISLFRATHLFSHEHQAVAPDFQRTSELSADLVARLLAFEDYSSSRTKTEEVCDLARGLLRKAGEQVDSLVSEREREEQETGALGQALQADYSSSQLQREMESVRVRVTQAGLQGDSQAPTLDTLRGWRGLLEARVAKANAKRARAMDLSDRVDELRGIERRRREVKAKIGGLNSEVNAFREEEEALGSDLAAMATAAERAQALVERLQQRLSRLRWAMEVAHTYREAKRSYTEKKVLVERNEKELKRLREELVADEALLDQLQGSLGRAREKLNEVEKQFRLLDEIEGSMDRWQALLSSADSLVRERERLTESLDRLTSSAVVENARLDDAQVREASALRGLEQAESTQGERRNLLARLANVVSGSSCPLCGQEYRTTEMLLQRIDQQASEDTARERREAYELARRQTSEVESRVESYRSQTLEARAALRRTSETKAGIDAELSTLRERAGLFEIEVGINETPEPGVLQTLAQSLADQGNELRIEIAQKREEIQQASHSYDERARELAQKESDFARLHSLASALLKEVEAVERDPRWVQTDFEKTDLAGLREDVEQQVKRTERARTESRIALERQRKRLSEVGSEVSRLADDLTSFEQQAAELAQRSDELSSEIRKIRADNGWDEATALPQIRDELLRTAQDSSRLKDQIVALERGVDEATTRAAMEGLRQSIRRRDEDIEALRRRQELYQEWLKYFESVSAKLAEEQSSAVYSFTKDYGPRTSVIQKRLRSVHGFDDVELRSEGSSIVVRAKRNGEEFVPTDYFSQSQQRTLLLGLFLTACISQTWSSLGTILLDDPVAHFDDLNAYAFLDLILGLLASAEMPGAQFIISTCDERFYRLAQHKLRHLGNRATFYSFVGIGEDGPIVQREG